MVTQSKNKKPAITEKVVFILDFTYHLPTKIIILNVKRYAYICILLRTHTTALKIGQKFSRCQAEAGKTYASSCCAHRILLSSNAFTKDCRSLNASSYLFIMNDGENN